MLAHPYRHKLSRTFQLGPRRNDHGSVPTMRSPERDEATAAGGVSRWKRSGRERDGSPSSKVCPVRAAGTDASPPIGAALQPTCRRPCRCGPFTRKLRSESHAVRRRAGQELRRGRLPRPPGRRLRRRGAGVPERAPRPLHRGLAGPGAGEGHRRGARDPRQPHPERGVRAPGARPAHPGARPADPRRRRVRPADQGRCRAGVGRRGRGGGTRTGRPPRGW